MKNHMSVPLTLRRGSAAPIAAASRRRSLWVANGAFFHVRDLAHQIEGDVELCAVERGAVSVGDLRRASPGSSPPLPRSVSHRAMVPLLTMRWNWKAVHG